MPKPPSSTGLSRRVASAQAEILRIATSVIPGATVVSLATRESLSCMIAVDTDAEKNRINDDKKLLVEMTSSAAAAGRKPDYLSAMSQETIDRRYNGHWWAVWR